MTLLVIIILCLALSIMALWKPHYAFGTLAGISWLGFMAYTRVSPLAGVTRGDAIDSIFILICFGMAVGLWLYTDSKVKANRYIEIHAGYGREDNHGESIRQARTERHGWGGDTNETSEDYQTKVHLILHPKRKKA